VCVLLGKTDRGMSVPLAEMKLRCGKGRAKTALVRGPFSIGGRQKELGDSLKVASSFLKTYDRQARSPTPQRGASRFPHQDGTCHGHLEEKSDGITER
jgi:hypothetical protein